jgi:hypothetical protein
MDNVLILENPSDQQTDSDHVNFPLTPYPLSISEISHQLFLQRFGHITALHCFYIHEI